jgi:hypothetical protein
MTIFVCFWGQGTTKIVSGCIQEKVHHGVQVTMMYRTTTETESLTVTAAAKITEQVTRRYTLMQGTGYTNSVRSVLACNISFQIFF